MYLAEDSKEEIGKCGLFNCNSVKAVAKASLYYFNPVETSDHDHRENTPNPFHLDHAVIERVSGQYSCLLRMMYMCYIFKGNVNHNIDIKQLIVLTSINNSAQARRRARTGPPYFVEVHVINDNAQVCIIYIGIS